MSRRWKVGDTGWICGNEMSDVEFQNPVRIVVAGIVEGDLHPIKVRTNTGRVYYCRESEIQTRPAKAERKPAQLIVPEEVKKEAEEMAEKRMEEINARSKPTFEEVAESFYSLAEIGRGEQTHARDVVISLAEKALFDMIKNGCRWEGETK